MAVTVEMLKAKLARVQQELAEVSAALEELAPSPRPKAAAPVPPAPGSVVLDPAKYTSGRDLLPLAAEALKKMNIDITKPAPTPEEVQEFMLREGVRPEDNLLSRGIIEAREE